MLLLAFPVVAQEDLCTDGPLLFREDFGGNDPDDPVVSTTPVPGMSSRYIQITNTETKGNDQDMSEGRYLVTKKGYRNSYNTDYSVWHIMDDHTYPGDMDRGYMLEIDATSGNDPFYQTTMTGLCEGTRLSFFAYVVNLTTAGQYNAWRNNRNYVHPQLSFVITDLQTNTELARVVTDTLSHDWTNYPKSWKESAEWQPVGMNFIVPPGGEVQLSIYNSADGGTGNDFAMDDIEVRLCVPKPTIKGNSEVCLGTANVLKADFTNDGTLAEPLEYKWYHSPDSAVWEEMSQTAATLDITNMQKADEVWYSVVVSGAGNMQNAYCKVVSEPFRLKSKECAPQKEDLCIDGTLLFREDFGGNEPDDPRRVTGAVEGMSYTPLPEGKNMTSGYYLMTKSGYCNGDTVGWTLPDADLSAKRSQWYIQDDHTYPGDYSRGYFLEVDGTGGDSKFYEKEIEDLCAGARLTFSAYVANVYTWFQYDWYSKNRGPVTQPCLKFVLTNPQNGDILATKDTDPIPFDESLPALTDWQYSSQWHLVGMNFTVPDGVESVVLSIYNNVTNGVGNDFALDDIEIRLCMPPIAVKGDNEVCEGKAAQLESELAYPYMVYEPLVYKWWFSPDSITWTEIVDADSETLTIPAVGENDEGWYSVAMSTGGNIDHVNCRTTSEPFKLALKECPSEPSEPTEPTDPSDKTCQSIIVNKYNWVLLVDNVKVRKLFPERTVTAYQWYKDGNPIEGATEDDYSEQNELHGLFQMVLTLDNGEEVCSNIIDLTKTPVSSATVIRVYNTSGRLVREGKAEDVKSFSLPSGVYLLRMMRGNEVFTEKMIVP